jgi:di/tricarboxylate transporter
LQVLLSPLLLVLACLAAAIVMFAAGRPRLDAVALLMLVALPMTGVITMNEALAGFGDANVVLIAAMFVIGDGLVRTGVAQRLGDWLMLRAGASEVRLIALLMLAVCALGAVMSSTAVTAIFIPVALRIAERAEIGPGRLMMPLSFAALISGMTTLVATPPNLVVNAELERAGAAGFRFFSFTPFGLIVIALGLGYMIAVRRFLGGATAPKASGRPRLADWIDEYGLARRERRLRVTDGSPLVGKTLGEIDLRDARGAAIVAIERSRPFSREMLEPAASVTFNAGDVLLVDVAARGDEGAPLIERYGLEEAPLGGAYFSDRAQELGMAEAIVPPDSSLVGQTLASAELRTRFGVTVVGMRRGGAVEGGDLTSVKLKGGDMLLMIGRWKAIDRLRPETHDLAVIRTPAEASAAPAAPGRALQALAVLALVVALMISGALPNVQAALIGCLLMGAFRCVTLDSAYRAIDWRTIVLIVGMLPFSLALQRTGGVELAADWLRALTIDSGDRVVLAALFAVTAVMGMFISNTATAILMAPVAIAFAGETHVSPYPFAMIVALAASTAFMTPVSSPVNTLVVAPGGYTFGDFLKVGVPFSVAVMIVCVILAPWFFPL